MEQISVFPYFVGALVFVGAALTVFGLFVLRRQRSFSKWPTTQGTITESSICVNWSSGMSEGRARKSFSAEIGYEYRVGAEMLTSCRRRLVEPGYDEESEAEKIVALYPTRSTVRVFYDSENPRRAVLEIDDSLYNYVPLAIGLMFFGAGVAFYLRGPG